MTAETSWLEDMPASYDSLLGPAKFGPYAREIAARAASFAPTDVLELAAGTGLVTRELLEVLPEARIRATDLNSPMVAWGSTRAVGAEWSTADAQDLPFPDDSFDLVVCQFGVMFFPDKPGAYAEMRRVLRPGGHVLVSAWDAVDQQPLTADLYEELVAMFPDDPPDFFVRVPYGYHDPAALRADAEAGGLTVESVDRVVITAVADSAATIVNGYCLGTPLRFALQKQGDVHAIAAELCAAMAKRHGTGPVENPMSVYVVTASS